ncbi:MAG: alpha/beta fold hydrolase [Planctomycetaceae bacterium]|nr:alpha/beta fold hydrolase [Planctomycetaceae bacterium]
MPIYLSKSLGQIWITGLLLVSLVSLPVMAQKQKTKKPKIAPPENVTLSTKDFVSLHCVYYPGDQGKKTVPVILVHGWEGPRGDGSGRDCHELALRLQKDGHAVVVPDLRGHGASTIRHLPNGQDKVIEREQLRPQDFRDMQLDIEAVKKFLLEKNNEGQLNIELLCVVGFDMGAVVGINWVNYDWSVPPLPTLKQGQDVKAFVLVSPPQAHRGLAINRAFENEDLRGNLSAMIIYGRQTSRTAAAGKRIYNSLKRSHRPLPADPQEAARVKDLYLFDLNTSLQGSKLLARQSLRVADLISEFIKVRLVDRADQYPWADRTAP